MGRALALLLLQPREAHGGPQFHGLCLLLPGNLTGATKAGFCLLCVRDGLQQLPVEPIQLGLVQSLPTVVRCYQSFSQHTQTLCGLPLLVQELRRHQLVQPPLHGALIPRGDGLQQGRGKLAPRRAARKSPSPPLHLRQRRLRLRQPEGHLHGAV
jgi:hypothetical protein